MRVTSVESTELFVGTVERPHQVVAVGIEHEPGRTVRLTIEGPGVHGTGEATTGDDGTVRAETPVRTDLGPGDRTHVTITAEDVENPAHTAEHTTLFTAA